MLTTFCSLPSYISICQNLRRSNSRYGHQRINSTIGSNKSLVRSWKCLLYFSWISLKEVFTYLLTYLTDHRFSSSSSWSHQAKPGPLPPGLSHAYAVVPAANDRRTTDQTLVSEERLHLSEWHTEPAKPLDMNTLNNVSDFNQKPCVSLQMSQGSSQIFIFIEI